MGSILIACRGEYIVSYEDAEELVVYDIDKKTIVTRVKKPRILDSLEDLVEEYDIWALVASSIDPETFELFRLMGIKVELTNSQPVKDYIAEVFV